MPKKLRGFTLIELLVVIFIIALLASLVIINVSNARKSSRDAKRVANLKSIQTALEMYNEKNGGYPSTITTPATTPAWWGYSAASPNACGEVLKTGDTWIGGLVSDFISTLPTDPKPTTVSPATSSQCYQYKSDGTDYMLKANKSMETCPSTGCKDATNVSIQEMVPTSASGTGATIAVWTSGAVNSTNNW